MTVRPARIVPVDPVGAAVQGSWHPASIRVSGGVGGWDTTERPLLVDVVEWRRQPPYRATFTWLFDGLADGRPVEADVVRLEALARPGRASRPAVVRFDAAWHLAGLRWVIDALDWADDPQPVRDDAGDRLRQQVDVTLLEYHAADVVPVARPRPTSANDDNADGDGGPRSERIITVAAGDTLWALADEHLGDGHRFDEIAELNDLDNPDQIDVGDELRLPPR